MENSFGGSMLGVGVLVGALVWVISLLIFYFLVKAAVRNGVTEAFDRMPAINVVMATEAGDEEEQEVRSSDETKKNSATGGSWTCSGCGVTNSPGRTACRKCNRQRAG